ncbi:MAG TPA: GNAT family N-acetyltransferase [Acidobacteriota bacterium]|jgi:amino-acid N-acetyltransferase
MTTDSLKIRHASKDDLAEILALLTRVGLPHEGVVECLDRFIVARDPAGRLVACAAMERHEAIGLLRSIAVDPNRQHAGVGTRLTAMLLEHAPGEGIKEVLLLTTTARDFFARCFQFQEASRADYDSQLASSPEWRLPRCSTAVLMRRAV